jgi:hypothetical protein
MKHLQVFLFLIVVCTMQTKADSTTVYGTLPSYALQKLTITYLYDPITHSYDKLATAQADSTGHFKFSFDIKKVFYGVLAIEKLRGYIFLEPGKNYEITLPDYVPKAAEDYINPYFEPYEFYIKVLNADPMELNGVIHQFDFDFANFLDKKFNLINMQGVKADFDSIENYYLNKYQSTNGDFLKAYIKYNIYSIKSSVLTKSPELIFQNLISSDYIDFQNPAFADFFEQNFKNFFRNFKDNQSFTLAIKNRDAARAVGIINSLNWVPNPQILQLGFIKGIYDAFYNRTYSQDSLIALLTNYVGMQKEEDLKRIAGNVLHQISKLRVGNPAPEFNLYNPDSIPYTLNDFRGFYVYLNFCTSSSFSCIQQYGLINSVREESLDSLKIITIAADDDFNKTYEHFLKYKYRWELLSFKNQPSVLNDYEIKAYPTYFLIDPEGNLLWSPAPGPNEGFAERYYDFIRDLKKKNFENNQDANQNLWK